MSWFKSIAELAHSMLAADSVEVVLQSAAPLQLRWALNSDDRPIGFETTSWVEPQTITTGLADWVGSAAVAPLTNASADLGWLVVASETSGTFNEESPMQLTKLATLIETQLDNELVTSEIERLSALLLDNERELAATQARLEVSNQELEQFAYIAAHELVAPLRSVAVYAEVLATMTTESVDVDPVRLGDCVSEIRQGVQRMTQQVQYLLSLSRAQQVLGNLDLVDTTRTAYGAVDTLTEVLEDVGATVVIDPLPAVLAHDIPLQSVFANLITNAVRYRSPDRLLRVHIHADHRDDGVNIAVADNAAGITEEAQQRIFALFERDSTDGDGLGVGLAVSRRILEGFGATISVTSSEEGSTFVLHFQRPTPRT